MRTPIRDWSIVACLADREARTRLWTAKSRRSDLRFVDTFAEVEDALRGAVGSVSAIIVTPTDDTGIHAAPLVRRVIRAWPRVSILAYCCATGFDHSHDLRTLGAAGVHKFLFREVDGADTDMRAMLSLADRERATDAVTRIVNGFLPRSLHPLAEYAIQYAGEAGTVDEIAHILGVSRRTLFRCCKRARHPPPGEMIVWCKLFLAAYLLEEPGRTIESVAFEMRLSSGNSLCNLTQYHAAKTPTEVRDGGGLDYMIVLFNTRLTEFRDSLPEAGDEHGLSPHSGP